MKSIFSNRIQAIAITVLFLLLCILNGNLAEAYGESGYYGQSSYYGQATYYAQSAYYGQGSYITLSGNIGFTGNLAVSGALSKGSGTFVIDHPLDPANKLLYHSFVESPDVKNIYDGITFADESGEAVVSLPSYFEALNDSYRYQVKGVSEPQPNLYIKSEIQNNSFVIAGATSGGEISWQVTATRRDPYIVANPIIVEVLKGPTALVNIGDFIFDGYNDISW